LVTTIRKSESSHCLRLTKELLQEARIELGDAVEVTLRDGLIVIAPVKRRHGSHSLEELVSRIPEGYRAEETAWGDPAGREEW